MTLILAVGNPDHAIIVADRRVLVDGVRVENGANDPALLLPRDTRLAAVFTGMARSGQLDTQHWLLLALHASLQPGGTISFEQLCLLADTRWNMLSDKDKRLTLVLAGHVSENGERYPALGIVSNWELPPDMDEDKEIDDRFRSVWWRHTEARNFAESFAVPAGMIEAITQEEIVELKGLAAAGATPDRIVDRCVEIIRAASNREEAEDEVGTDCVSIVLSASPDADPVIRAHHGGGVTALGKPSVVTPDSIVTDHEVVRAGESGLLAREKVGRNSACPCGNGRKYKHCHGA